MYRTSVLQGFLIVADLLVEGQNREFCDIHKSVPFFDGSPFLGNKFPKKGLANPLFWAPSNTLYFHAKGTSSRKTL
jgi:hypothetical protein